MVRVKYTPLPGSVFQSLFREGVTIDRFRGGSIGDISVFKASSPYIKGSGWFGRIALPLFKRVIAPNLLELGANVLSDVNSGSKLKSSLKRRGVDSLKKTAKQILTGSGKKTRRRQPVKRLNNRNKSKCKKVVGGKKTSRGGKKKNPKNKKNNNNKNTHKRNRKKCIFDSTFGMYK